MSAIQHDRLSIVVGVTGHRDIAHAEEAPLRDAFARILERLQRSCPHTPMLVLSGLAAGADSLAAQEAMERGIPVIACLPMPVREYEKDFTPEQLQRFRTLLAGCSRTTVTSPSRENGYVATGLFIAKYSQLLVAFWDGQTSRGAGGTADVIAMRLGERTQTEDIENLGYLPDVGPVDIIVTPRESAPRPADAYSVRRAYQRDLPHETADTYFAATLSHIDTYNVDLAATRPPAAEQSLEAVMERTDAAANNLQRHTNRFQMTLLICAFLAAAVQVIGTFNPLFKVAALAVAFAAYGLARKNNYENRYQDYRAIAEGLRVQAAWCCAGLKGRLVDTAYLRMQAGELQWIRLALRFFYLLYCEDREFAGASYDHPVCQDWIGAQWEYYRRAGQRAARLKRWLDGISSVALVLGVACSVVFGMLYYIFHQKTELTVNLVTVPFVMAAVLKAVFMHYAERQNLAGSARRYERMFGVFDRARRDLREMEQTHRGDPARIVYDLGQAALAEHADWLLMRRDRPLQVVIL
jgi:hypothetical protein